MFSQLFTNRDKSAEPPLADSESTRQPLLPDAPYKPYSEKPALPVPPYKPYAEKSVDEVPYEPYKDI